MNDVMKSRLPTLPPTLPNLPTTQVLSAVSWIESYLQYKQVQAREETRREEIRAQAKLEIERIRAQAEVIREYLAQVFAERREIYLKGFEILDAAIENKDTQAIQAGLGIVLTVIRTSPLQQALEVMQQVKNRKPGELIEL